MNKKRHIVLLLVSFSAWLGFFLLGLPSNYFVDWSVAEKILLSLITAFSIVPYISYFVLSFLGKDYFKTSIWFSFYASVLVFLLDYIVVGLIQGNGIGFLLSHWPSTIGYFYVWISIPLVGFALERSSKENG